MLRVLLPLKIHQANVAPLSVKPEKSFSAPVVATRDSQARGARC